MQLTVTSRPSLTVVQHFEMLKPKKVAKEHVAGPQMQAWSISMTLLPSLLRMNYVGSLNVVIVQRERLVTLN